MHQYLRLNEYSAYFLSITYTSVKINQILCKIDLKSKLGYGTFTIYVLLTAIELPATFLELLRFDRFMRLYLYITLIDEMCNNVELNKN